MHSDSEAIHFHLLDNPVCTQLGWMQRADLTGRVQSGVGSSKQLSHRQRTAEALLLERSFLTLTVRMHRWRHIVKMFKRD